MMECLQMKPMGTQLETRKTILHQSRITTAINQDNPLKYNKPLKTGYFQKPSDRSHSKRWRGLRRSYVVMI